MEQRRVADGRHVELLAGHGRADHGKDARTDDRPNAERGQRPRAEGLLQGVTGLFRIPDQLIDRFAGKQLAEQFGSPHPFGCGVLSLAGPACRRHSPACGAFAAVCRMRISYETPHSARWVPARPTPCIRKG